MRLLDGLPNMTNINLGPPEMAAHLSRPLVAPPHQCGVKRSSVGTLVERISRYVILVKLDDNTAQEVLEGFKRRYKRIPESLRKAMKPISRTPSAPRFRCAPKTSCAQRPMNICNSSPPVAIGSGAVSKARSSRTRREDFIVQGQQ